MRDTVRHTLKKLACCTSGNTAILLAMGMPVLLGGAGLGVDVAQWYMWKRELQNAVDQGAIAGAWAKGQQEDSLAYLKRVEQEYKANLSMTLDFASDAKVALSNYDGGTNNSIEVKATATNTLPFTSFFMDGSTTIAVEAQAIYEPEAVYDPCLLALDKSAPKALWFHGGPLVNAQCGGGAISDADNAISFEGSGGEYDLNFLITAGRVNDIQGHTANSTVVEGANNLVNPFEDLTPPDNSTPRTYSCAASQYSADQVVRVTTKYSYFSGKNRNQLTAYSGYPYAKTGSTISKVIQDFQLATMPSSSTTSNTTTTIEEVVGAGNDRIWEREDVTTETTYTNISVSHEQGKQLPGTYKSMDIKCDTTLAPGVYVIDGGDLTIESTHDLTGNGVMFVLKNGAGIRSAGSSSVNLTAMSKSELLAAGVAADDVDDMLGMLIFEDPDSRGNNRNKLTGNSTSALNGVVYLPSSGIELLGAQRGVSQCLVVAAKTINVGGTANLTNLCESNSTPLHKAAVQRHTVRLIK